MLVVNVEMFDMKLNSKVIGKAVVYAGVIAGIFATSAFAASNTTPVLEGSAGWVASNLTASLSGIANAATAISFVVGMGFAIAAMLKFKQHKDNPTQVPVGAPIAMLFVGVALIFMPSIFRAGGVTLFGNDAQSSGVYGISTFPKWSG